MKLNKRHINNIALKMLVILQLSFLSIMGIGCKKLIEVPAPTTSITSASAYNDDATAASVLTGIYASIAQNNFIGGGLSSTSFFCGLSADELTLYSGANSTLFSAYYTNALTNVNGGYPGDFWGVSYAIIYDANSAIQGLTATTSLTPAVKQQLLGEATFMRAFCYFYLVNLYGDVPLVTGTNYTTNAVVPRTPKAQVWQQIITDLKTAQGLLSKNYLDATLLNVTSYRVRPTYWAATALLARVYLYYGNLTGNASNYAKADSAASVVIANTSQFSLEPLTNVFLANNNNEAIWQLQPVTANENTPDAWTFIIPSTGPNAGQSPVYLNNSLLNSFEAGDQRKTNWVDTITVSGTLYYFAYKYKSATYGAAVTEYEDVLRLGELYLIRAEAQANGAGNGLSGALADLNAIRTRAGLPNSTATQSTIAAAILHERQVELFTEWGHRWLDLKRTGNIDAVMSVVCPEKDGTWSSYKQLYPIALTELQRDPFLVQNQGY